MGNFDNAARIAAGLAGNVFHKFFTTKKQDSLTKNCDVSVLPAVLMEYLPWQI